MKIKYKYIYSLIFILSIAYFFLINASYAGVLTDWKDSRAYKPRPVLFLHGFGSGSPVGWNPTISTLSRWFSKYQPIGSYLETLDFQDSNGSVDTYSDGRAGWADKVKNKINKLLLSTKYGFYTHKLNLVSHSMGGLAAREYLTNSKYPAGYIDKLILIGVPNLGSRWADYANDISKSQKAGWLIIMPHAFTVVPARNSLDYGLETWLSIDIDGEAVKDMMENGSFLNALNSRPQPPDVGYYGIYGIIGTPLNWFISGDYFGGDGVVSKTSQLGVEHVSFKEVPRQIPAFHTAEPAISVVGDNPLLKFLDSTKPVLEITYPGSGTTEIYESSIHIQGKVYKEYLPADTKLTINVRRQEDGYRFVAANTYLKPSDLWIPNNPDLPVAEFDEVINFPGKGTYKISCQVKNPAGLVSDIKDVWVKVVVLEGTNIIVHCHNPEGKEIASIQGMSQNSVGIYDGNTLIGYGAHNAETHNKPIAISTGTHTIKAKFNGTTRARSITLNPEETKVVIFTFERTEFDIIEWINSLALVKEVHKTKTINQYEFYFEHWDENFASINTSVEFYKVDGLGSVSFKGGLVFKLTGTAYEDYVYAGCSGGSPAHSLSYIITLYGHPGIDVVFGILNYSFTNWFIQSLEVDTYPGIVIKSGDGVRYYITAINSSGQAYHIEIFPADKIGTKMNVELPGEPVQNPGTWAEANLPPGGSKEIKRNGTVNLKMSSVPYDLTGSGI